MFEAKDTGLSIYTSFHLPEDKKQQVIYAKGSYFDRQLPDEIEFLYIVIENKGPYKRTVNRADICICHVSDENTVSYTPLPVLFQAKAIEGKKIDKDGYLVLACLREHFTAAARNMYPGNHAYFCARCEILDGRITTSPLEKLDLNFPMSPLQDLELLDYYHILKAEQENLKKEITRIEEIHGSLSDYASLYLDLGIHLFEKNGEKFWRWREYAPDGEKLCYVSEKTGFKLKEENYFKPLEFGWWELQLPFEAFTHGMYYELRIQGKYQKGFQKRVPAFANWVEQNQDNENLWCARFWNEDPYIFQQPKVHHKNPLIYEAHIGLARDKENPASYSPRGFGTYTWFAEYVLPRIKENGYNTVQLMGVVEHPLYKSFGYQVGSYYAVSHRFGTINDFKRMVDKAHELGIMVLLDIVHSHACPNTCEGLTKYDTGPYYFHNNKQTQWGTSAFDYENEAARRFLLSNCRYWQEEYLIDGFRFDAVGSMIFVDEGFGDDFTHVNACFYKSDSSLRRNSSGILFVGLANTLIHELDPEACTIAEEFSGAPGITSPVELGGLGFNYRFAMGLPDFWAKNILKIQPMWKMWHECTNHRVYEKTISYVECHDQCINGEDAMIWRIMGDDMYTHMSRFSENWSVSRGIALLKLMKFITALTSDKGYMTFMGNEFGHPEWIDAEVNPYRQWYLTENDTLHYLGLQKFDTGLLQFLYSAYFDEMPRCRLIDEEKRLLVFERNDYLFAVNFHETQPADFSAMVSPGKYKEIFTSDDMTFGGHNNLTNKAQIAHFTREQSGLFEQSIDLYLPPLTALALIRE